MDDYRQYMLDVARQIAAAKGDDIIELARIGGRDPRTAFRGGDWSGADFRGRDLRGFDFRDCRLTGARFQNALLADALFDDAIDVDLRGAIGAAARSPAEASTRAAPQRGVAHRSIKVGVLEALWTGLLATWTPQLVAAGAPLGPRGPVNIGVSADLQMLLAKGLTHDIDWAVAPLRLTAAYDEAGVIRSIRAVVNIDPKGTGDSPIFITLRDTDGIAEHLALTRNNPSAVCRFPALSGQFQAMSVTLSALRSQ